MKNIQIISVWIAIGIILIGNIVAGKMLTATNDLQNELIENNIDAILKLDSEIKQLQ